LHDWHGPLHASAQQMLSPEQNPLAQSAPFAATSHSCPSVASHVCAAEQTWLPGHLPATPAARGLQLVPPMHDWHGPPQASAQQMLSAEQRPLAQSPPSAHGCPFSKVNSKSCGSKELHAASRK
jgi:hypothetical protein